jgi:DNA-dependent RNA polymerase auxiliary subunit epsilon
MKIFRTTGCTLFWPQKKWRNFGSAESRTSRRETKKLQIHLAATCNKNEQQQDAKNNAEFVEKMDEDDLEDLWRDH